MTLKDFIQVMALEVLFQICISLSPIHHALCPKEKADHLKPFEDDESSRRPQAPPLLGGSGNHPASEEDRSMHSSKARK